jgi:hypothetical protein
MTHTSTRQHRSRDSRGAGFLIRLFRLASPDGRRLLQALLLLIEVEARLHLTGFSRLQERLHQPSETAGPARSADALAEAPLMAHALRRAARWVPNARCLHRALALLLWLCRRGVAADLRMGVRTGVEGVEGHAWVEWHGLPLDEDRAIVDSFALLELAQ